MADKAKNKNTKPVSSQNGKAKKTNTKPAVKKKVKRKKGHAGKILAAFIIVVAIAAVCSLYYGPRLVADVCLHIAPEPEH